MLNLFYRALNNKKGFTLIEVLVVVAIIGILAALAAPRIIGRIEDSRKESDRALASTIEGAIQQYVLDEEIRGGVEDVWGTGEGQFETLEDFLTDTDIQDTYFEASTRDFLQNNIDWGADGNDFVARTLRIVLDPTTGSITTDEEDLTE